MYSQTLDNILKVYDYMQKYTWDNVIRQQDFFYYLRDFEKFDNAGRYFYSHDAQSTAVFDWIIQYRACASFFGFPPAFDLENAPFTQAEWQQLTERARSMTNGFAEDDYLLDRIDTWLLESYSLHGICEADKGDIVFDCGTYSGNTTLYFADKVGSTGHVYGFEAHPETFKRYRKNIAQCQNCSPVRAAVAATSGIICFSDEACTGSHIQAKGIQVAALSLDDFVRRQKIKKVDFIKMDIEGAEADALHGAKHIIRKFHPKMAISAYHKFEDLYHLPQLIRAVNSNYIFYLRHYSDCIFETVLFCVPVESAYPHDLCTSENDKDLDIYKFATLLHIIYAGYNEHNMPLIYECHKLFEEYRKMSEYLQKAIDLSNNLAEKNKQLKAENHTLMSLVKKFGSQATSSG